MGKYIDKDALVAEIKKIIPSEPYPRTSETLYGAEIYGKREICFRILDFLNTLEVKEVDLEKEISFQWSKSCLNGKDKDSFVKVAKHFFELGLKVARKGE